MKRKILCIFAGLITYNCVETMPRIYETFQKPKALIVKATLNGLTGNFVREFPSTFTKEDTIKFLRREIADEFDRDMGQVDVILKDEEPQIIKSIDPEMPSKLTISGVYGFNQIPALVEPIMKSNMSIFGPDAPVDNRLWFTFSICDNNTKGVFVLNMGPLYVLAKISYRSISGLPTPQPGLNMHFEALKRIKSIETLMNVSDSITLCCKGCDTKPDAVQLEKEHRMHVMRELYASTEMPKTIESLVEFLKNLEIRNIEVTRSVFI